MGCLTDARRSRWALVGGSCRISATTKRRNMHPSSRRRFIRSSFALAAGAALLPRGGFAHAGGHKPKLHKAVKFGMIGDGSTIEDKFALIKSLGFDGVEMDSPSDVNVAEAVAAAEKTGVTIHGVIDSVHWK